MGAVLAAGLLSLLSGCGSRTDSRRIVRIGHNQSVNHPTHLALTAFQEMIGERLGDRFRGRPRKFLDPRPPYGLDLLLRQSLKPLCRHMIPLFISSDFPK